LWLKKRSGNTVPGCYVTEKPFLKQEQMKKKINWTRVIYIIGVIALIIGAVDPMEGSVVIASGSTFIALSTFLTHDRHWKIFLVSFIMISIGVLFLFYLSSLGGFGGTSTRSWWWGILIIPYPVGWLIAIVVLIIRAVKKQKLQASK
jgi:NADH:ubiquinone oxidoreductase subunit 6 (subunit J)